MVLEKVDYNFLHEQELRNYIETLTFEAVEKAYNMGVSDQEAVLDKISDEIRNEQSMDYKCHRKTYDNCLRIIDKYKVNIRGEGV